MQTPGNSDGTLSRMYSGLGRHLILVLLFKTFFLIVLWHTVIKPYRVEVDSYTMSARMSGSFQQSYKENSHDRFNGR